MIPAPYSTHQYPGRLRDCQRSVVIDLNALIDQATTVGWDRREVIMALVDLLDAEATDADGLLRTMARYMGQPTRSVA
ncbi:hypothetical protein [Rhizobium sp. P44RR-XXIV]|uniref:hypothetical protein n=1 Tax=Rhizobium sp. P44RR-XXIV TaxID=1921145 RepID=UPI0009863B2F|nr:hypothetical protein [Rhizobium sp. P44RR-XXIV]TIX90820.1 hypothetical protein BSK43_016405 [Rhizobium sp. P44RR-XXIV]